jgi:hypothetical protein
MANSIEIGLIVNGYEYTLTQTTDDDSVFTGSDLIRITDWVESTTRNVLITDEAYDDSDNTVEEE